MAAPVARASKQQAAAEGLGSNQKAVKYLGQDFETLRQKYLDSGVLVKDPEFPACPPALDYEDLGPCSPQTQGIVWKRPVPPIAIFHAPLEPMWVLWDVGKIKELCPSPQFIVGGATRTDVCQGMLGDCWLLAAVASLTLNEELLYRVVPRDQNFQENYGGIFHFQFWQYGGWVEVVVDDRLPTKDGELLFLCAEEGSELWSTLLEKAYANKPQGMPLSFEGGFPSSLPMPPTPRNPRSQGSTVLMRLSLEGFEDFTGGISELYELKNPPIIRKALRAGSLLACSIDVSREGFSLLPLPIAAAAEAITSLKLVKSHASSVTGVEEVDFRGHPEKLMRLRNPWGEVKWMGARSDDAPEWNYIDPRQKEELDKKAEDGEFWMSFSDFLRLFSRLEICNLSLDSLSSDEVHKWNLILFNGYWIRGSTAGGCQHYPATYWTNPQFKICLDEVGDHQEESIGEPGCTVLLGLLQKNRRRQKRMGQGMLSLGYAVYKLESHTDEHLGRVFFLGRQPSACSSTYVNLHEVSARVQLPPGEYAVVPSTFGPFKDGDFCLRVFSEKKAKALGVFFPSGVAGVTEGPGSAQVQALSLCGTYPRLPEEICRTP
ncbi:hypothetical protein EI555_001518 [Monodon monoceros]|uniref:Calpain catalytic domain-containing protein n=1 Tax=Monodon monoceros TaxID=40151 RepID=A0A4V5P9P2_MONMO|nr:hypothetical protein EI555_001518 [Monodon monoceros]